ncbi:MAG: hypothetical protein HYT34_02525 [Candidatus Ryanbacteria bacterium]|nr:hypothetical protein [Candidatus Ryanbacteria bacterium]
MADIPVAFEKNIIQLLAILPPRSRGVVKKRYGFGMPRALTLEAIGKKEGITRERVRQIENDAIAKLRKSKLLAEFKDVENILIDLVRGHGGLVSEDTLLTMPEVRAVKDKKNLIFFLDLIESLRRVKEDEIFYARWQTLDAPREKIESALRSLADELERSSGSITEDDLKERLENHLRKEGVPEIHLSYLSLAKHLAKNVWGEYGHISSPFIRPRGMREGAYVALARSKKPLHFREIAEKIREFTSRNVHVQTVHNELIKDARFVLVGRGLYALKEWGYEPGFIKDVLVRILKERGSLNKDQILEEMQRRRQVKPATVLINLQNKKLFKAADDGTYTLVS